MEISADTLSPHAGAVLLSLSMLHGTEADTPANEAATALWLNAMDHLPVADYRAIRDLTETLRAVRRLAFWATRDDLSPNGAKRVRHCLAEISSGNT